VSFLDRFRRIFGKEKPAEVPEVEPREEPKPAEPTEAMRIAAAIGEQRFADAERILRRARDGSDEASTLDAAISAFGPTREDDEPAGENPRDLESLHLAIADMMIARGAREIAARWLSRATSPPALVLRADLLADGTQGAPSRHDLDLALALLSRALRADIDAPGARDRWERLRRKLGVAEDVTPVTVGATLIAKGSTLPFVLIREVARGGAGVVYEARETLGEMQRIIALKIVHVQNATRSQLAHEARVAVRFRGAGVVPIHDVDPEAGWLAMAWAAGGSLRSHLRKEGAVDDVLAKDVRAWLRPLLATLADVHREGWVHGDIKPANVLFDEEGRPLLGDFGLARAIGSAATPGSAGYVSPERIAGAPASPKDDVFGIGRILEDVFEAGWPDDPDLRALAKRCLAPDSDRPATASDLL